MSQEKFPLFSANFGDRLRWLRTQRGLSQSEIAEGSASTASSWEKDGKMPRSNRWEGISEKLGLSWSFVSTGNPRTTEDYAFLRESRNLIDWKDAPTGVVELAGEQSVAHVDAFAEDQAPYGTPAMLRNEITRHYHSLLADAGDDVARLGWLLVQTQTHLKAPADWKKKKAGQKPPLIVDAPEHQRNPVQPGSAPSRKGDAAA